MTEKEKNQNNVYELKKQTNQGITPKGSEFDVCVCFFQSNLSKNKYFLCYINGSLTEDSLHLTRQNHLLCKGHHNFRPMTCMQMDAKPVTKASLIEINN